MMHALSQLDMPMPSEPEDEELRATWPTPPPIFRRSCLDLISWIHALRSDETTRALSLDDVLERAMADGGEGAHAVWQITTSAFLDGSAARLTRFFSGIIADVVSTTATSGPSARTVLIRVDAEGPRSVVVEVADLRRVIGGPSMEPSGEAAIEIVRASDALLGITVSADRDPSLGTVMRIELPAHPRR